MGVLWTIGAIPEADRCLAQRNGTSTVADVDHDQHDDEKPATTTITDVERTPNRHYDRLPGH